MSTPAWGAMCCALFCKRWATEHTFDALLSTDGDADRPLIGDEAGFLIGAEGHLLFTLGNLAGGGAK